MSRGLGTWQRTIMEATDCAVVVPVGNVVRTSVVTPSRNDFASARRAAKLLAIKSQVAALYAWSCPRCGRVQDRPDPEPCCARPRSMLSVCRPERRHLVRHPAPAPGGSAPRWLSDAHPAPTGLLAPTVDDPGPAGRTARLGAFGGWHLGGEHQGSGRPDEAGRRVRAGRPPPRPTLGRHARRATVAGPPPPGQQLGGVRRRCPRQSAARGHVGASPAKRDGAGQVPRPRQSIALDCPSRQEPFTPASSDLGELLRGLRRAGGEPGVQG